MSIKSEPPLSLYIHIPWCVKKCPYCDFNSHATNESVNETAYIDALMHDLDQEIPLTQNRTIRSIFFGGGTPSLFSAEAFNKILTGVKQRYTLGDNVEITMEANPGTFEQQKFAEFNALGINRLSVGVQSFDNGCLQRLGRIHDSTQAETAITTAQQSGFDNINVDLMFGLPGQTTAMAINDIEKACGFNLNHISHYQLTIEPNTFFHKHPPRLPDMDLIWDMQTQCHALLAENNFNQYEVSAFAKDSCQCRHNINYWQFGDYIGIGAGAHGKITDPKTKTITRRWKHRQPQQYILQALAGNALSGESQLNKETIVSEFLMNALRLREGVSLEVFHNSTGLDKNSLLNVCQVVDPDLLVIDNNKIKTSETGYRFLNSVLEKIV